MTEIEPGSPDEAQDHVPTDRGSTGGDDRPPLDPDQLRERTSDVGGPQAALGSEAESALIGDDAESGDEGRTGSNPNPTGV